MVPWFFAFLAEVSGTREDHVVIVALITAASAVATALIAAIPAIVTSRRTKRRMDELLEEEGRKQIINAILVQLALDPPLADRLRGLICPRTLPTDLHDEVDIERIARALAEFDRAKRRKR